MANGGGGGGDSSSSSSTAREEGRASARLRKKQKQQQEEQGANPLDPRFSDYDSKEGEYVLTRFQHPTLDLDIESPVGAMHNTNRIFQDGFRMCKNMDERSRHAGDVIFAAAAAGKLDLAYERGAPRTSHASYRTGDQECKNTSGNAS